MIDIKSKKYLKETLSMYKTFTSIRAVEDGKWKLSYVFGNRFKLEKGCEKLIAVRGSSLKETKIVMDKDVSGYYCFECICESRELAMGASDFLDNQLEEGPEEDVYDYPIQGEDY